MIVLHPTVDEVGIENPVNLRRFGSEELTFGVYLLGSPAAGDYLSFQYFNGQDWVEMKSLGIGMRLDKDTNFLQLKSPMRYKYYKPVTTNPIGFKVE